MKPIVNQFVIDKRFAFEKRRESASIAFCSCPSAEPGKIKIDASEHIPNCWVRRKLATNHYNMDTSITPDKFMDGYSIGVAT
jgi:hypothetical protein